MLICRSRRENTVHKKRRFIILAMENLKYWELFTDKEEKSKAFDVVAEMFYDKNFSSATKSEIELLMFSIYMDATIKKCKRADGTIDYNICSDYEMGKELGIPQEKVRALKLKKQARYPVEFDWQQSLLSIKDNVRYDSLKRKIIIPIRDPNLYNEIRNYIENNGGYIEVQRSGNVIQIRPEHYFMLMYANADTEGQKKYRKAIVKALNSHNTENTVPEPKSPLEVLKQIVSLGTSGIGTLASVMGIIESPLWETVKSVMSNNE